MPYSSMDASQRIETAAGPSRRLLMCMARVCVVLLIALVAEIGVAHAQQRPNAEVAQRAISQLRSPYCPTMLETCTSPEGAALRDSIYDLAEEGVTADEIVDWMLARHGEEYRAAPRRSGAGLWAWIIPPLVLLLAAGVALTWLRARSAPVPETPGEPESAISDEDREMLTAALREWEESGEEVV